MSAIEPSRNWQGATAVTRSTARTHVGLVRQINEDRVFDWADGGIWAVVDGMGGHRGGDLAAQSVVDGLRALQTENAPTTPAAILVALQNANATIFARNAALGEQAGATVVALSLYGASVHLAWAGDSRCYRVRDGTVQRLTRDHSVVQELVDAGLLTPETAAHHPRANVITRALGVDATCDIEWRLFDLVDGDRFLLCSDGLSRSLCDEDLCDIGLDALADQLLALALRRDGADNISLVVADPRLPR